VNGGRNYKLGQIVVIKFSYMLENLVINFLYSLVKKVDSLLSLIKIESKNGKNRDNQQERL
jgi:hypothetical protein